VDAQPPKKNRQRWFPFFSPVFTLISISFPFALQFETLYTTYFAEESKLQINVDYKTRQQLELSYKNGGGIHRSIFDQAQYEIGNLLENDPVLRFETANCRNHKK
jgi:hypothetical protein